MLCIICACIGGDHCSMVSNKWGVVTQRTPNGLQRGEWEAVLTAYHNRSVGCNDSAHS